MQYKHSLTWPQVAAPASGHWHCDTLPHRSCCGLAWLRQVTERRIRQRSAGAVLATGLAHPKWAWQDALLSYFCLLLDISHVICRCMPHALLHASL